MGKNLKGRELGKGLTQRKDGRYSAKFTTCNGIRKEKCFSVLGEAKAWLRDAVYQDAHGTRILNENTTVDQWFDAWIEQKSATLRPNSIRNYRERYLTNIKDEIGSIKVSEVRPIHCQKILNKMAAHGYKGSTIYQTYMTMAIMFKSAYENMLIIRSPVTKAGVKLPVEIVKKVRFLTVEEEREFLNFTRYNETSMYDQYVFALNTGVRTSELIGLKFTDVDWKTKTVHIQRNLEFRHATGQWIWGPTKTKSSNRIIPLTQDAYDILLKRKAGWKARGPEVPEEFRDIVFLNRNGTPWKNSAYDTKIYYWCQKAGIRPFSMHTFRHTFATRCVEAGMNFKTLSVILGHSSTKITMDVYAHVTDETKVEEIRNFESYMQKKACEEKIICFSGIPSESASG